MKREDFFKKVLDKWLKLKSSLFITNLKKDGAKLNYVEEHKCRRSYEMGIIYGMTLSVELAPKRMDFLKEMEKEILLNLSDDELSFICSKES